MPWHIRKQKAIPPYSKRLLGDGYQVGNFGLTAHTLMMKGNLPYMSKQPFKDAQAFLPDIVTIKLGTNDSKPINWIHKEDFKKDLNTMIDAFEALPSHPRIYLCLPIPSDRKDLGHQRQYHRERHHPTHPRSGTRT